MAQNKMLIDATHPEETRVVVVRGNKVDEFDFESETKKQNRGNIYLAKITRVEPSLQAAFVDYGGNRHGFLAFSEIHPDYYQIPIADRQALLDEEAQDAQADKAEEFDSEEEEKPAPRPRRRRTRRKPSAAKTGKSKEEAPKETSEELSPDKNSKKKAATEEAEIKDDDARSPDPENVESSEPVDATTSKNDSAGDSEEPDSIAAENESDVISEVAESVEETDKDADSRDEENGNGENGEDDDVESVGAEDALEEVPVRRKKRRIYKIQEVIKRRQIILVQIVKEERGNKGAALTTYLSLAGRYSVLMPNTARGGGISRKITSISDRKRLKTIAGDLDVPSGMGVILRTAGASRTKAEIRRDFEYLLRLWENVRNLTLESTAPCLVYEEGSLIKRSIRDLYNKETGEIIVAGDVGYREAKGFMRMLMPSHAKNVKRYTNAVPLFTRNGVEAQLDKMLQPQVTLRSGGYLVINQTEALVAVDVNSGRSTRQHSIEDTAVQTNLEAAEEVARQLRLRDLAGLIVIDFIDMEEKRNNRAVEKRLKDALKDDRARIQVSRISHFGLLEMSRQRIRASVLESTTRTCPTCEGVGHVRAPSSVALHVLRSIEEFLLKGARHNITVKTSAETALYILNSKRMNLVELEARFGLTITLEADDTIGSEYLNIERGDLATPRIRTENHIQPDSIEPDLDVIDEEPDSEAEPEEASDEERPKRKRRRRRRSRGKSRPDDDADNADETETSSSTDSDNTGEQPSDDEDGMPKRRRRGRRGGRKTAKAEEATAQSGKAEPSSTDNGDDDVDSDADDKKPRRARRPRSTKKAGKDEEDTPAETDATDETAKEDGSAETSKTPRRATRRPRKAKKEPVAESGDIETEEVTAAVADAGEAEAVPSEKPVEEKPAKSRRTTRRKSPKTAAEASSTPAKVEETSENSASEDNDDGDNTKKKGGWWQRRSFF